MTVLQTTAKASAKPHLHIAGEHCPLCEQPIPNERYEEISKRILVKERERQAAADAKAKAEIDAVKAQSQAQIETLKAETAAREAAAIERGKKAAEAVFGARLAEAAEATKAATERGAALQAQLETARTEGAAKEVAALDRGKKLAEAAFDVRLAEAAEATKAATERGASLQAQLDQSRSQLSATVEKMNAEFTVKAAAIQTEVQQVAEAAAQVKVHEAEQKVVILQASQDARLLEQREALEKSKTEAVNAERSKAFEEKLKLEGIVDELQRKLQNKTADELGEGAEVDLYEELKAEFPEDDIQRVGKGKAGADIIHNVRYKGQACGCIIYDSKNHQQWRSAHVTKLREDQIHAKADHAILSTHAFPSGMRQLHIEDSVIIAKPARAIAVAMMVRKHMVEMHTLRVSSEERVKKADELYAWITSARFNQFLDSITKAAEELEELQLQERKALEPLWKKQGERIRSIIRSRLQLGDEVDRIIGTSK